MNLEFYLAVSYQEAEFSGFHLYDLNADGIPELLLGCIQVKMHQSCLYMTSIHGKTGKRSFDG